MSTDTTKPTRSLRKAPSPAPADPDTLPNEHGPAPDGVIEVTDAAPGTVDSPGVPATTPQFSPPARVEVDPASGVSGDWDEGDVRLPYLTIVQGSGELSQRYNLGTLILGDDELLPPPDLRNPKAEHTLRFVPFALSKAFREKLSEAEVAAGAVPRFARTMNEMIAQGGTTEWRDKEDGSGKRYQPWAPEARVSLLIERPSCEPGANHPLFANELDGGIWAPAVYNAKGQAFKAVGQTLFNALFTVLTRVVTGPDGQPLKSLNGVVFRQAFLPKRIWTMKIVRRPAGDYVIFLPEIKLTNAEPGPEMAEFISRFSSVSGE